MLKLAAVILVLVVLAARLAASEVFRSARRDLGDRYGAAPDRLDLGLIKAGKIPVEDKGAVRVPVAQDIVPTSGRPPARRRRQE